MTTFNNISATEVAKFMIAADQTVVNLNTAQLQLYGNLCKEECMELLVGINKLCAPGGLTEENLQEVLDGAGDLVWVALGAQYSCGVNPQQVHDAIATSNHTKTVAGKLVKHPVTKKVLKPDTYKTPELEFLVRDILVHRTNLRTQRTFAIK